MIWRIFTHCSWCKIGVIGVLFSTRAMLGHFGLVRVRRDRSSSSGGGFIVEVEAVIVSRDNTGRVKVSVKVFFVSTTFT